MHDKTALWPSLSLKVLCTPPPPRARKIRRRNAPEAGFSITGVLVSSSIGLIVLTGTMQTLVNISRRLSVQEARLKQPLLHSYLIERFAKTGRCTKTLEGLKITENAAAAPLYIGGPKEYWGDYTSAPRQHVTSLKDASGTVVKDLHSAQTQKDFKRDFDIDKFASLIFRGFYPEGDSGTPAVDFDDPGDTEEGRAELRAIVMDKGQPRKPIIIQLRGVKLKKDGHGTGSHKITACHSVNSVADVSAEIAALKARIKALEDLGLRLDGGDLMSTKNFKTKSGKSIFTQGAGSIHTKGGGEIYTLNGGNIYTHTTGNIYTGTGRGNIYTHGGHIHSSHGGSIHTKGGGSIYTENGGHIYTHTTGNIYTGTGRGNIYTHGGHIHSSHGGSIHTKGGGSIYTENGGHIYTHTTGNIYTGSGRGNIYTHGGHIHTSHGGSIHTRGGGSIHTKHGGDIFIERSGNIYTKGSGFISTRGGGSIHTANGGNIYTHTTGNIYTGSGGGKIYTHGGHIETTGSGNIRTPRRSLDGHTGHHSHGGGGGGGGGGPADDPNQGGNGGNGGGGGGGNGGYGGDGGGPSGGSPHR